MPVNPDFRDLFAALNDAGARFLLVGGYALAHHGHPRFTRDLDVWVEPEPANSARVFAALEAFGAPLQDLRRDDLEREGVIFQIGVAPNRIDIITGISWRAEVLLAIVERRRREITRSPGRADETVHHREQTERSKRIETWPAYVFMALANAS